MCGPLLRVHESKVDIVHQSVRDYLLSETWGDYNTDFLIFRIDAEDTHAEILRACIRCLESSTLKRQQLSRNEARFKQEPALLEYAVVNWPEHAKALSTRNIFEEHLFFLEENNMTRRNWAHLYADFLPMTQIGSETPVFHIACALGISQWVKSILGRARQERSGEARICNHDGFASEYISHEDSESNTALTMAIVHARENVVQLQREYGAEQIANDGQMKYSAVSVASEVRKYQSHRDPRREMILPSSRGAEFAKRLLTHGADCLVEELAAANGVLRAAEPITPRDQALCKDGGGRVQPSKEMKFARAKDMVIARALARLAVDLKSFLTVLQFKELPEDLTMAQVDAYRTSVMRSMLQSTWTPSTRVFTLAQTNVLSGPNYDFPLRGQPSRVLQLREYPLLHLAAGYGNEMLVKAFLDRGADVDYTIESGSPLHIAVSQGHTEVARLLLERKANINARGRGGSTALHHASSVWVPTFSSFAPASREPGRLPTQVSSRRRDKVNIQDSSGRSALHLLMQNLVRPSTVGHASNIAMTDYLLREGADVHLPDDRGNTAYHALAILPPEWNVSTGTVIQELSDDFDRGSRALNVTESIRHSKSERVLRARLLRRFNKEYDKMEARLLQHGADPNVRNVDGHTPADLKRQAIALIHTMPICGTHAIQSNQNDSPQLMADRSHVLPSITSWQSKIPVPSWKTSNQHRRPP